MFKTLQLFLKTSLRLEDNTALGSALGIIKACSCLEKQASVWSKTVFYPAHTTVPERADRYSCKMQDRDHRAAVSFIFAEVTNGAPSQPVPSLKSSSSCSNNIWRSNKAISPKLCPDLVLQLQPTCTLPRGERCWLD